MSHPAMSPCPYGEQPLAVLHRLAVLYVHIGDFTVVLRVDLVHQLHRFDDAQDLTLLYRRTDVDERRRAGLRRPVEGADNRRLHDGQLDFSVGRRVVVVSNGRSRRNRRRRHGNSRRRRWEAGTRHGGRRDRRWQRHDVRAVDVLADFQPQAIVLDLELREIVFADQVEDLFDLVQVHQTSIRSVVTSVSTSTPPSVTSTSSSMRTPPQPGTYAPGSIVKIMPAATASSCASTSGRRRVMRGFSCTSMPSP